MTTIQIERLKAPTIIHRIGGDFGSFGAFAEVQEVEFDGYGYTVTARMIDPDYGYATDHEVQFFVDAGGVVDFGGIGEPKLRAEADISADEWQAKIEANDARCDVAVGKLNDIRGTTSDRELSAIMAPVMGAAEALSAELLAAQNRRVEFYGAVAKALGVDALEAAE